MDAKLSPAFQAVCNAAFSSPAEALAGLRERLAQYSLADATAEATRLIQAARKQHSPFSIESFLQRFALDTTEGVALLRLAEALLRVPDAATAEMLLRETLAQGEWKRGSAEWPAALTAAGLGIAARLLRGDADANKLSCVSAPAILRAARAGVRWMGSRFVLGDSIEHAIRKAARDPRNLYSYDMLGESAITGPQAQGYTERYLHAVQEIGKRVNRQIPLMERDGISVKLSALHPRYEALQIARLQAELLPRLRTIVEAAMVAGVPLTIDAEEAVRLELSLELFAELAQEKTIREFSGLGIAVQAYHMRALPVLAFLKQLSIARGVPIPVRLVKGAYWDAEIKQAQILGLPEFPVFTQKPHTDISYLACAAELLEAGPLLYPQFGTHNARTLADILAMADGRRIEFQRLYGMGKAVHTALQACHSVICRVYAPVGPNRELLAYLIRRLLENGASNAFVQALGNNEIPVATLARSPFETLSIPDEDTRRITPPHALFLPHHKNSPGYQLSYHLHRAELLAGAGKISGNEFSNSAVVTPKTAITKALAAFQTWAQVSPNERSWILEKVADIFESHRDEALFLLREEGKKTWNDAIGEWREAQDFCRYYAAEARKLCMQPEILPGPTAERNRLSLHPRGVFLCISPWNFPMAIFTGQVVAALVTGNCVVAKPAEQTPRMATACVRWLREAGVPQDVLQLVTGGVEAGRALVADTRIAGVAFTGSTETAWAINQALAEKRAPIVPFIAETGGQNAMIIDSTVLLEQTVGHVLASAFGSAGQRCSALRVAFVQEDIVDDFIALLDGAMQQLQLGDVADPATDIGPVIDKIAQQRLLAHIAAFKKSAKGWGASPLPLELQDSFVAPHWFEISDIRELPGEVFGPVLHIIRYPAHGLAQVIESINQTGFGLTLGIETRIATRADWIVSQMRVGNIYINRAMTGAVVGAQPFGGEGLSGTGPKAGGPHYLQRFMTERVVSENLAAVGGNLDLLMGETKD